MTAPPRAVISVSDLYFSYAGYGLQALKNVSLEIEEGDFFAIVGQNGSGKTTLVKHFNGLLRPTHGRVVVDGIDTSSKKITVGELSKKVGYVFQNPDRQIFSETIEKEIRFGLDNIHLSEEEKEKRIKDVISLLKLEQYRKSYPRVLPLGIKKKICIASVLAMRPKVIVFDEPTTGQDYNGVTDIMKTAEDWNKRGGTVVFITHDMHLVAKYARKVAVMSEGELIGKGEPASIFRNASIMQRARLKPPQVVSLSEALEKYSCPQTILTVEDFSRWVSSKIVDHLPSQSFPDESSISKRS